MKSKRILSLVLALVMVLGTFGTVFAEEAEEVLSHGEKIQWLIDNGIVEGNAAGDLMLDKNIDRASVAKMVVYALDQTRIAEGMKNYKAPFVDVPVTNWSNGNINVVATEKLMIGNSVNQFMPSNEISYAEVLTVLVRIVMGEDLVNPVWPTSYIAKAHELGILEGVNLPSDFMAASNRKDILEMFYNAMVEMEIGNYQIVKAIVLENNRVESIGKDEVVVEVIREMQRANYADASRKTVEKGDQEKYIIPASVGNVEDMLGKVYDLSINKDNLVVNAKLDNSYNYYQGSVSNITRNKINNFTVELDERYRDKDERIFRTYHNDKAYAYREFENEVKSVDYARITTKNGKVLFIDSFTFEDIAPVESARRDGSDVYVYNDIRDGRVEKFEPKALVIGYKDGKFLRIDKDDIRADDVVHAYGRNKLIVRQDAQVTGVYQKVERDSSGRYYAYIEDEKYEIRNNDYYRPVYAHDSKAYSTLYRADAQVELASFYKEEVKALIGIDGSLQLFGADVQYNEGMTLVEQILARGQVKFVQPDNEKLILDEDYTSVIKTYKLGNNVTTTNQRLNAFDTRDLTFVKGNDDKIATLVRFASEREMEAEYKALNSVKAADMNNSFIRMADGTTRYQVLDRTNVFVIDKNGSMSGTTVAKLQASLVPDSEIDAYVVTDKDFTVFEASADVTDRNRITEETNIAHTIVFFNPEYKAAGTDGETVLVTNVYTARSPHYVRGQGPDNFGKESIERTAKSNKSLSGLNVDDIVSLRLTKDDDKLVDDTTMLIPRDKVKTESYKVVGGQLVNYSRYEGRRLLLEDANGDRYDKWLVRGVEEFGTITLDSIVTFHEANSYGDIDVIRVYGSSYKNPTANAGYVEEYEKDAVKYNGVYELDGNDYIQLDGKSYPYVGANVTFEIGTYVIPTFTEIRGETVVTKVRKALVVGDDEPGTSDPDPEESKVKSNNLKAVQFVGTSYALAGEIVVVDGAILDSAEVNGQAITNIENDGTTYSVEIIVTGEITEVTVVIDGVTETIKL